MSVQGSSCNFQNTFCHRFLSELNNLGFVWPNKCLNARPYWRKMLVWLTPTTKFWTTVLVMPSEHAAWPYNMANYSHMGLMPRCLSLYVLENVQIKSYMCATHVFIPFCSMHPDILTIRVLLNEDQLCGQVYAHFVWPNYSNHYCRQQMKVSWN